MSLSFDVKNTSFTTINIKDFVEDIIDGEDAELVRKTPSMRAGAGLRYAHAFSPLVFRFGATVDFDLAAVGWVPIGLAAGYSQDSFPEGGADITDVVRGFLFRIGYTGREDLALGLNFQYATFPTDQLDTRIKSTGLTLDIRYYF
jgi:hypothetical protein